MSKQNFIFTQDKDTANSLINQGLKLLNMSNGTYIFVNDTLCNFEQIDNTKIFKTNKLTF